MSNKAAQLSKDLPSNLRKLAGQLVRKPSEYDTRWARSVEESFQFYTRTSTINSLVALDEMLRERGWPFPAYLDIDKEMRQSVKWFIRLKSPLLFSVPLCWQSLSLTLLNFELRMTDPVRRKAIDWVMCRRFRKASRGIFTFWRAHQLLYSKRPIIQDLEFSYRNKHWGVCVPALLPLLDYLIRNYFQEKSFKISIDTLIQGLKKAGISYKSVKPGYSISENLKEAPDSFRVADCVEDDLRLPGVYLASFINFAELYYSWCSTDSPTFENLNRHAILHGAMDYWSEANTVKLLMFFDLTLKLEKVLRLIIGSAPQSDRGKKDDDSNA